MLIKKKQRKPIRGTFLPHLNNKNETPPRFEKLRMRMRKRKKGKEGERNEKTVKQ